MYVVLRLSQVITFPWAKRMTCWSVLQLRTADGPVLSTRWQQSPGCDRAPQRRSEGSWLTSPAQQSFHPTTRCRWVGKASRPPTAEGSPRSGAGAAPHCCTFQGVLRVHSVEPRVSLKIAIMKYQKLQRNGGIERGCFILHDVGSGGVAWRFLHFLYKFQPQSWT